MNKKPTILRYNPDDLPLDHGEVGRADMCNCVICEQWKTAEEVQRSLSVLSSGTVVPQLGVEYVLATASKAAKFAMSVDTANMAKNDSFRMAIYEMDGGYQQRWHETVSNRQSKANRRSPDLDLVGPSKFTIQQTAGAAKPYSWLVAHAKSCACGDCRTYRVAENRALAASNRRDLLSEIAFHAQHDSKVLNGNWRLWLAEEFSQDDRSEGWWGTRLLYNPLAWWLRRFQTWAKTTSGHVVSYYSGPAWVNSDAAWLAASGPVTGV